MPRRGVEDIAADEELLAKLAEEAGDDAQRPPRLLPDGSANRDYFRYLYGRIVEVSVIAAEEGKTVANLNQMLDGFRHLCKMHGVNPDLLAEQKTDAELMMEAADRLLEHSDAIFELEDRQLDLIEQRMQEVVKTMGVVINDQAEAMAHQDPIPNEHLAVNYMQQKRKRGRPRKHPLPEEAAAPAEQPADE